MRGTLGVVRNGSGDPWRGAGRVGEPSRRTGMGRGTLWEVRKTLGEVRGHSQRSETGLMTLPEVRDGSGDPQNGSGRVGRPSERSGTGRETLGEVRDRS